jgi:hypothetical protein
MAVWHIVVLYLAIFALLQFVVYRYLKDRNDGRPTQFRSASNPDSGRVDDRAVEPPSPHDPSPRDGESGARFCTQCGARNDPDQVYSYCRNCANPLGRA